MGRVRVGILMEGTRGPFPIRTMIETLRGDANVELFPIRCLRPPESPWTRLSATRGRQGVRGTVGATLFHVVATVERWLLAAAFPARFRDRLAAKPIDDACPAGTVTIGAPADRRTARFADDEVAKVRALDLQLLVRGTLEGEFAGGILGAAQAGILSLDYRERGWRSGWPPGLREVRSRMPATGFAVLLFTPAASGGTVVLRTDTATQRSFAENRASLYAVSWAFLAQAIGTFARTGAFRRPAETSPSLPAAAPGPGAALAYACRTLSLYSALAARRLILGKRRRWSVAFARAPWNALSRSGATVVRNPEGRFLADPFVVTKQGRSVIFVEDYAFERGRGAISAVVLDDAGGYAILPDIVAEPFHLSFPFLFDFAGDLYMVPESHEARSIRLYRCARFPDVWEFMHELMADVRAADTMVLRHAGRWWLLANIAPPGCDAFDAQLCAFSADTPLSRDWTPHPGNPVVLSCATSRNGGFVRDEDGAILRVRQRPAFGEYGESMSLARIVRLDETAYDEEFRQTLLPDFLPGVKGTHHMHSDGTVTVFDFVREERVDR